MARSISEHWNRQIDSLPPPVTPSATTPNTQPQPPHALLCLCLISWCIIASVIINSSGLISYCQYMHVRFMHLD